MAPELKLSRLIYSNRFIINFKSLHNFLRFQFGKCTSTKKIGLVDSCRNIYFFRRTKKALFHGSSSFPLVTGLIRRSNYVEFYVVYSYDYIFIFIFMCLVKNSDHLQTSYQ